MEESLEVLREYEAEGIREVWLTPHVMEDIPNCTEELRARFEELKAAYKGTLPLHLAAEYMLDSLFEERLMRNDLLTLGLDRNRVLVETSFFNPPMDLYGLLGRIQEQGYQPVLAHPERYMYMAESDYRTLHQQDVLFQLNLFSLSGAYGKEAKRKAEWLKSQSMVQYIGTDTHGLQQFSKNILGKLSRLISDQ